MIMKPFSVDSIRVIVICIFYWKYGFEVKYMMVIDLSQHNAIPRV